MCKWILLKRALKPAAILGAEFSQRAIGYLNIIFTFQGFGLLFFDIYFQSFNYKTLIVFLYSFLQLINFDDQINFMKQKISKNKFKNKEAIRENIKSKLAGKEFDGFIQTLKYMNQNIGLKLIRNKNSKFKYLNPFFVTDYDRLNPITKTVALYDYQSSVMKAQAFNKIRKNIKNTVLKGLISTVTNNLYTGNNMKFIGLKDQKSKDNTSIVSMSDISEEKPKLSGTIDRSEVFTFNTGKVQKCQIYQII